MTTEIKNERNHVMTTAALPRMRTIPQAFKEIKALDPDTSITMSVLRRLVKEGAVETSPGHKLWFRPFDSAQGPGFRTTQPR